MICIQFSQYSMEEVTAIHVWRKVIVEVAIGIVRVVITRSVLAIQKIIFMVYSNSIKHKVVSMAGSHDSMEIIT